MKVPIKIKIDEKGIKLEEIAKGDVLVFPNGRPEETVKVVDINSKRLYTQRKLSRKIQGYVFVYEKVIYDETRIPNRVIISHSVGKVYETRGVRK